MFKVVVAHRDDLVTSDAVRGVLDDCEAQLEGLVPCAGLLFSASFHDPHLIIAAVNKRFPGLELIGCTTDGEMSGQQGYREDTLVLTLFASDEVQISAGVGRNTSADPARAAEDAVSAASDGLVGPARLAITLPDGMTTKANEILTGLDAALGGVVPLLGGMSADQVVGSKDKFETFQFFGTEVLQDSAPVLLLGGPLLFSLGVRSGWSPLGEPATVTSADGQVLHQVDGRPAWELYQHYLGHITNEDLSGLGAYPLAVYEEDSDRFYLRVASGVDADTGAIQLLGEVPVNARVQITQAVRDDVIEGVSESVSDAIAQYPGERPAVAMLFSCTGRKLALGTKTREEVLRARDLLSLDVPICGFYTFGEISPLKVDGSSHYHNTTFVTLLLGVD